MNHQNLKEWLENPETEYEFIRDGSASCYMDYMNIFSIEEALTQFLEYSEQGKIDNNLRELGFQIRLKDSPFFLDSSNLAYDIDLYSWSNPPKFYLNDKKHMDSSEKDRSIYLEIISVSFIPLNFQCEYSTFTYTDGDKEIYVRFIYIKEKI